MTLNVNTVRDVMRAYKVPYAFMVEKTGYSREHLSLVLHGHKPLSPQFQRLVLYALGEFFGKENLRKKMKDMEEFSSISL